MIGACAFVTSPDGVEEIVDHFYTPITGIRLSEPEATEVLVTQRGRMHTMERIAAGETLSDKIE